MAEKQWYFDAGNPSVVPDEVIPVLDEKGIPKEHIRLCAKADLNRDMIRCDCWLMATETDLIVLLGSVTLTQGKRASGSAYHKLKRRFEVLSWDVFDLGEVDGFKVEEQIASARFTAKKPDGSTVLITNLTNTYKQDFFMVTRYLSELKKDGRITPDE